MTASDLSHDSWWRRVPANAFATAPANAAAPFDAIRCRLELHSVVFSGRADGNVVIPSPLSRQLAPLSEVTSA